MITILFTLLGLAAQYIFGLISAMFIFVSLGFSVSDDNNDYMVEANIRIIELKAEEGIDAWHRSRLQFYTSNMKCNDNDNNGEDVCQNKNHANYTTREYLNHSYYNVYDRADRLGIPYTVPVF